MLLERRTATGSPPKGPGSDSSTLGGGGGGGVSDFWVTGSDATERGADVRADPDVGTVSTPSSGSVISPTNSA